MKIAQLPLIVLLSVLAMGCTSDEEDELLEVVYDEELYEDGEIDPSSKYAFSLLDDRITNITLKGDLGEIYIEGGYNRIEIEKDTHIEELTIIGEWNVVNEGFGVTIDDILIIGHDNEVRITACIKWDATGDTNSAPGADACDTSQP